MGKDGYSEYEMAIELELDLFMLCDDSPNSAVFDHGKVGETLVWEFSLFV